MAWINYTVRTVNILYCQSTASCNETIVSDKKKIICLLSLGGGGIIYTCVYIYVVVDTQNESI